MTFTGAVLKVKTSSKRLPHEMIFKVKHPRIFENLEEIKVEFLENGKKLFSLESKWFTESVSIFEFKNRPRKNALAISNPRIQTTIES